MTDLGTFRCAHKSAVVNGHLSPDVHGSITRLPRFGNERLQDDALRERLRQLSGLLTNYMASANQKPTIPNTRTAIWDNNLVRDEILNSATGLSKSLVPLLRNLLNIPDGVSIKEKVTACELFEYRNPTWIRAILVSLFSKFVFHQSSPFEDDVLLLDSLEYSKPPKSQ